MPPLEAHPGDARLPVAGAAARRRGPRRLETVVRRGHEVGEILAFAREGCFDLLVLGAHGHSRIFERILGSTSLALARLAPCSVFIVRPPRGRPATLDQIKRILVGVDGSPLGRLAFRTPLDLATLCAAAVLGVTVREVSPLAGSGAREDAYADQLRAAAGEHARAAGVGYEHVVRTGHAAQVLREEARAAGADLVVAGATGLEHPWSVTLGGTAAGVAIEAACSVLLVRPPQAALHVRDLMVRAVSAVTADTPLSDVVELLLRRDVKALPVLDPRRRVVGIITGGDLLTRGGVGLRLSIERELDPGALREQFRALARGRLTARDVMTRHVHTVGPDTDLATVIRLMAAHRVKRLPVVDGEKTLVGIVSRADVLRTIAAVPVPETPAAHEVPATARMVAEAAVTEVPAVPPDAAAQEVLERLLASPLRRVVVVDGDGRALGLVSDRDLLVRSGPDTRPWLVRVLRGGRPASRVTAGAPAGSTAAALVAPGLVTVRPEDSLVHAVRLMMQHRVKRLVVVDDQGRFRGLVDRREILRLLAEDRA